MRHPLVFDGLEQRRLLAVIAYDGATTCPHDQTINTLMHAESDLSAPLTFSVLDGPEHGTFDFETDGSFDFIPNAGFAGIDSFVFQATDGTFTDTATFTLEFSNTPPTAFDASHSVLHDQALSSYVTATNADADTLTFAKASDPLHGVVTVNSGGEFQYTPAAGYVGSDTFTFSASDGVASATGTITVEVTNQAPVAVDDSETVGVNDTIQASVYGADDDGDELSFAVTVPPPIGTFIFNELTGEFEYDPPLDFEGSVSFEYEADDGPAADCGEFVMNFQDGELPTVSVEIFSKIQGRTDGGAGGMQERPGSLEGEDVRFRVFLTLPQGQQTLAHDVTVNYATQDGEFGKIADADYSATTDALTFTAGAQGLALGKLVTVPTIDDVAVEDNEDFQLRLTASTKAKITTNAATGYIRNEDVTISVFDTNGSKSAGGADVTFAISGLRSARENGLNIKLKGDTSDGTATAGQDYTPLVGDPLSLVQENGFKRTITILSGANVGQTFYFTIVVDDAGTSDAADVSIVLNRAKITTAP